MAAVSASDIVQTEGDTDVIATSNNDVLGDSVDSGTFNDLQNKINNASEGSTIELLNNYTYDDTFESSGIIINKSLTIEGNGFTIDGANQARIFFINATNGITLNNIVFTNALSERGGAILFDNSVSEVIISNSVFTNNSLFVNESVGGAINFDDDASQISFENTTFENNYAPLGYGGSIAFDGHATMINFDGCTFRTNKVRENNITGGGAIYIIKNATFVFIENCEFNNLTAHAGGAIHVEGNYALSMIGNTKFTNNKAYTKNTNYGGGAISIEGNADGTAIEKCEFINNTATTHGGAIKLMENSKLLLINDTVFDGNYAPYAGALCLKGTEELIIIKSEFTNNKGTDADIVGGGAIYIIGNLTRATIVNSLFENNSARTGGGIYVEGIMDKTTFIGTEFTNNSAFTNNTKYGGGAIAVEEDATNNNFKTVIFTENTATTHGGAIKFMDNDESNTFDKCIFLDNYAPYGGSIAVSNKSKRLNLTTCIFKMSEETPDDIIGGGAIYFIGDVNTLYMTDCAFDSFSAHAGGAIYVEGDLKTALINNTDFINNKATTNNTKYGGGAIDVEGNAEYFIITESNFINNTAQTHGGAIKLRGNNTYVAIASSTFDGNYAPYAGAISLGTTKSFIVSNSRFTNNKGTDEDIIGGGAIYIIGNLTKAHIDKTDFTNNSARAGGAIYIEGIMDKTTFTNTYFTNNTAFTKNPEKYGGGAIAVEGNATNNNFKSAIFTENTATTHGGAIHFMNNEENNTYDSCIFTNNYAPFGGAISVMNNEENNAFDSCVFVNNNAKYGGSIGIGNNSQSLNLINCIFTKTEEPENVGVGGGAIYIIGNSTELYINNCEFNELTAHAGGAIYVEGALKIAEINGTQFINNKATTNSTYYGGGSIYVEGNSQYVIITESNFINNTAQTHGGAIKLRGNNSFIIITNSTFDGNYAPYAGAISLGNTELLGIYESIFTNNKGTDADIIGGGAIYVIGNLTTANVIDSLFENNSARAGGAIYVEGTMDKWTFKTDAFINNTAFTNNTKYGGGAITVQGNATNNIFNDSLFTLNTGTTHGGAINFMGNAINNTISECEFLDNNAKYGSDIAVNKNTENLNISKCNFESYLESAQEVVGGGALYFINNVTNLNIDECNFSGYTARAGGAIFFEKTVEKTIIENCIFENNEITTQNEDYGGGAISIENDALDLIIGNCEFINNTASTKGGAIFINNAENILIDNVIFSENTAEDGRALYLNNGNDVKIQNSSFINNTGIGCDIHYAGNIISSIANSTFDGTSHILAGKNSVLTLTNNKELDAYLHRDYFIYNEGALFLENNTLSNVIYNNGMILSPTTMTTLFNETINTKDSDVTLNAYCEDDNGNVIVSDYGLFCVNDTEIKVFYNDDIILYGNTVLTEYGSYLVYATTYGTLYGCIQKYGIINYDPKKDTNINASDIELEIGQYGEIEVELPEDASGIVTAVVDDEVYMAPVKDGKATIIIRPLEPGEYEATIYYSGDNNYKNDNTSSLVTVLDKISVVAPDVTKYYHGSERFVVNVTKSGKALVNASVEITINNATYTRQTDENGIASIGLNIESGNYTATVKVNDVTVNSTVTILPTVNGSDVTKVYRNGTQYYATFLDSEGNYLKEGTKVTFNINGVFYNRTISGDKGLAKLNINLEAGEYIITAINTNTTEQTANTITVISRITENKDITKYYRNGTQYTATILGDDGKPVGAGETVRFNINGVFYERQTNGSGQVKLNINLQPGDYIITAEYKGCMVSNNIKVLPVLTAEDMTKKYGTQDPFEAKLVDGQGNAYSNQKVEFNINGVFYYRMTESNGIAKLNINLQAGEYIITSTYNSCSISNKITITA